jgi:RNA polymerase sigma-70 factor (ECF subfamily)
VRDVDESRLIERAKAYDAQALSELYRRYSNAIFRYVYYRLGDQALAEDVVSDVFVRALEALPGYQDTGRPFAAWLYRIAHARVVDHYRRHGRRQFTPLDERLAAGEEADPQQLATHRDASYRAWQAMNDLTEDQQQVLSLRFIAGYSTREAAEVLGKTEGAVKALQHRALASLRRLLEDEG